MGDVLKMSNETLVLLGEENSKTQVKDTETKKEKAPFDFKKFLRKIFNKKTAPFFLLFPAFLYYAVFWLSPILVSVKEVFTDSSGNFVLFENFVNMAKSDLFAPAVLNTALFALISVILQYVLALGFAVLLNRKGWSIKVLMFIIMIPMAITPTAVAILWKTGLMSTGWLNSIMVSLGIVAEPYFFLSLKGFSAIILLILIDTWTVLPSVLVILLAGMQNIPKDMKEAALTFGANKYQILKDITIPLLKPSIITSVILRMMAAVQIWAIAVMVMGYSNVPFLVERIAYYIEYVPGMEGARKLAFTLSFLTAGIVFVATMIYYKVVKKGTALDTKLQK